MLFELVDITDFARFFQAWADFKAAGGVISQTVSKSDAIDFSR
jgi:hypothetical protein